MDIRTKFFLRSRQIQAALIAMLSALTLGATSVGISLPSWLTTDWLTSLLDSITGDSGLGAALLLVYAALLNVGSKLRPDPAGTKLTLSAFGEKAIPLAPSLRAAAVAFLAIAIPGLAIEANAAPALVYVPSAPVVGGWAWTPAEGATAYNVYVSRNGGAFSLAAAVTKPSVSLVSRLGETIEVIVEPLAPGTGSAAGPLSDAGPPVRFVATADLDGDGIVGMADFGAQRAAFSLCIPPATTGLAVPAGPCAP